MGTVYKGEISRSVAKQLNVSEGDAKQALDAVLESIQDALGAGDSIALVRFGKFEIRDITARKIKYIGGAKKGSLVEVPSHRRAAFRPGSSLKEAVNAAWYTRLFNKARGVLS